MTSTLPKVLLVLSSILLASCGRAAGPVPAATDIEKAMRATWERPASGSSARTAYQANSIKIGTGAVANEQDKIDGIPPGAWVTIARVDFTVRTFYTNTTQAVRRVRDCKVYKNQFDEWAVMIGQKRGEDQTNDEPVKK